MEVDPLVLIGFLATQALQTLQLWSVRSQVLKVGRTLTPPPMPPPPLAAYCQNCGGLTAGGELRHGLCPECLGTNPTERPYDDPHAAAARARRRRRE